MSVHRERRAPPRRIIQEWFASGGMVLWAGPFQSQKAAWKHLRLTAAEQRHQGVLYPPDAKVWR